MMLEKIRRLTETAPTTHRVVTFCSNIASDMVGDRIRKGSHIEYSLEYKITGGRTGPADPATARPMIAQWCLTG